MTLDATTKGGRTVELRGTDGAQEHQVGARLLKDQ